MNKNIKYQKHISALNKIKGAIQKSKMKTEEKIIHLSNIEIVLEEMRKLKPNKNKIKSTLKIIKKVLVLEDVKDAFEDVSEVLEIVE